MKNPPEKFVEAYRHPFWQEVLNREASYLRKELANCNRILEVGCGVGVLERLLPGLNIIGLDNDPAMLAEARRGGGVYVQSDALNLCFRDAVFDGVFFVTSLEFMNDYRAAVSEAARVLAEGGFFVAMMLNPRSWHFKNRVGREGSYLKNVSVQEPGLVGDYASKFFGTEAEYFLGIREDKVFDSSDESLGSLYVVKGRKL